MVPRLRTTSPSSVTAPHGRPDPHPGPGCGTSCDDQRHQDRRSGPRRGVAGSPAGRGPASRRRSAGRPSSCTRAARFGPAACSSSARHRHTRPISSGSCPPSAGVRRLRSIGDLVDRSATRLIYARRADQGGAGSGPSWPGHPRAAAGNLKSSGPSWPGPRSASVPPSWDGSGTTRAAATSTTSAPPPPVPGWPSVPGSSTASRCRHRVSRRGPSSSTSSTTRSRSTGSCGAGGPSSIRASRFSG